MRSFKTNHFASTLNDYNRHGYERNVADDREVGIEIEVEGRGLPRDNLAGWVIHEDGSLRGESAEYVFRQPEPRTNISTRLRLLDKRFRDAGSQINQSYRTSVHVHVNARPMFIKDIYTNVMLYVIFEDILSDFAGKDRIGNLFCLRAKDAGYFLDALRTSITTDNLNHLNSDNLRYSAVNTASLFRHGSLEYRQFRGTVDMDLIEKWVGLILALKDAATSKFKNPIELVQQMSTLGPVGFAQMVFNDEQIALFERGWEDKILGNVQLIQHAAYGHDWVVQEPKKKKADPGFYGNTVQYALADDIQNLVQQARTRIPNPAPAPQWAEVRPNPYAWPEPAEPDDFDDEPEL